MESNDELIDYLEREGRIETERVGEAFRAVDRKKFVPGEHSGRAYEDVPLSIGQESTISAPHMVAINTDLLEVGKDDRVLEIGSGSGYQLAILAELTDNEVIGVERLKELVEGSRKALELWENAEVIHGNGLEAIEGKFDRILFSCGIDSMDEAKEDLAEDGVIVAPLNTGRGQVLKKYIGKEDSVKDYGRVRFVPYRDEPV